ncbi:sigma factor G inhibitor Gin [Metallumcola ferriviriculae]|uniref:sigma factor G inhibitor Gin n=1 Tax=Metallumcola ferriviriculae TaxID=3039180 RepID=UPI00345B38C9
MAQVLPHCIVCGETPIYGFKDGIFIKRRFICSSCETIIIGMHSGDQYYNDVINSIKKIWA